MVCCEPHNSLHLSQSLHLCQWLYFAVSLAGCFGVLVWLSSGLSAHFFHKIIVINTKTVHLRVTLWSAWAWLCVFILWSKKKREGGWIQLDAFNISFNLGVFHCAHQYTDHSDKLWLLWLLYAWGLRAEKKTK